MQIRPCLSYYWGKIFAVLLASPISVFLGLEIDYLIIFPGLLLALFLIIAVFLHRYTLPYVITPEYLESRKGLISVESVEIACRDIRAVEIRQGLFGRIFGYGDIEISTAVNCAVKARFVGVYDPPGIKDLIRGFRDIREIGNPANNNSGE